VSSPWQDHGVDTPFVMSVSRDELHRFSKVACEEIVPV